MSQPQTQFFTPITSFVFQYSYPMAMIGSILYSIVTTVSIDTLNIIGNEEALLFINIFIGVSGLISIFAWFNLPLPDRQSIVASPVKPNNNS